LKRLEGTVAVVTGGNSGIGLASAKRFREEGASVAIAGRSRKTLDEAIKVLGDGVVSIQEDVSYLADIDKIYLSVENKFGKIDILFVNAKAVSYNKRTMELAMVPFAPFSAHEESISHVLSTH
jgi:NAD(P)-dependent dehydrogenase (short-subunit alcohol dehydrogenase family)